MSNTTSINKAITSMQANEQVKKVLALWLILGTLTVESFLALSVKVLLRWVP